MFSRPLQYIATVYKVICLIFIYLSVSPLIFAAEHNRIVSESGQSLVLNNHSFYVNQKLKRSDPASFQFNSLHQALAQANSGSEQQPMIIYLEPDVYQANGSETERGLIIEQDWLSLIGLSDDAHGTVIADNRGHMIGANSLSGSSPAETLFITGTGFYAQNLTIGNYCNVELIYPLNPAKNQAKRSTTITQAYAIGAANHQKTLDKYRFINVRFISMLDTLALGAVKRTYFEKVFVQGTDDFIGGGDIQVFNYSTIHSYSSKPIYAAGRNGTAILNSQWNVELSDKQALTIAKNSSTLYLLNTQFNDLNNKLTSVNWSVYPQSNIRSFEYNTQINGVKSAILPLANAVQLSQKQAQQYSANNLLKGEDNWQPVSAYLIANQNANNAINKPLNINLTQGFTLTSGEEPVNYSASVFPQSASQKLVWLSDSPLLKFSPLGDNKVVLQSLNNTEQAVKVTLTATAENGIYNRAVFTLLPALVAPPKFTEQPSFSVIDNGKLKLNYRLALAANKTKNNGVRTDQSTITWYRVGSLPEGDLSVEKTVKIAVSRLLVPTKEYRLTMADVGYYIMAEISPKSSRSTAGKPLTKIFQRKIAVDDIAGIGIEKYFIQPDLKTFPIDIRSIDKVADAWVIDRNYPQDQYIKWRAMPNEQLASEKLQAKPWQYDKGINGADSSFGLLTTAQGARLLYKQKKHFDAMKLEVKLNTEKQASQGFGSPNGQYLELYIKYDVNTLSGYALRIERTAKYGFATDFTLYQYRNGKGKAISESVSSSAFSPLTTINLLFRDDILLATVTTKTTQSTQQKSAGLIHQVELTAQVKNNNQGGFGLQHTGTVGLGGRIQLTGLSVNYH